MLGSAVSVGHDGRGVTPTQPQPARTEWIDVLRGEMVVLIVAFHSTGLMRHGRTEPPDWAVAVNDLSEPFWMPTLSFISGVLASSPADQGPGAFYARQARTILYPFAVWTTAHAAVFGLPANRASALKLATGGSYLFFLVFLAGFNVVDYHLSDAHPALVAAGALTLGGTLPTQLPSVPERMTERFWYLLAMYMLGRLAARYGTIWCRLRASRTAIAASAAAMLCGAIASTRGEQVSYRAQWAWSPALALIVLARTAEMIQEAAISRPLRFVGRNSIVYYTTHFPIAYRAIQMLDRRGLRSSGRTLASTLAVSLAAPTALVWARRHNAAVRRLFVL